MRTAIDIILTAAERRTLRNRARQSAGRVPLRARVILLAAMGWTNRAIAEKLRTDPHTVARWRNRFAAYRVAGIEQEAAREGRRRRVRDAAEPNIIRLTRRLRRQRQLCSSRGIAKRLGVNHMLVFRVWKDHGLVP